MRFASELIEARLIKRYKRFLADVELADGSALTCVVGNTGSMHGLTTPGSRVLIEHRPSKTRKYAHDLQIVEADGVWVGVNTGLPNRLTVEALEAGLIPELAGYDTLATEKKYGQNSRIDILLTSEARPPCYVEVKNVHMVRTPRLAEFPDSVTTRGTKHLGELAEMVRQGNRAAMVYLNQRDDIDSFAFAPDFDPAYYAAAEAAAAAGVEFYALACRISPQEIAAYRTIPVEMPPR